MTSWRDELEYRWDDLIRDVGARYRDCRLSTYQTPSDAHRAVLAQAELFAKTLTKTSPSLMLFGPRGSGKDHLAVALARIGMNHGAKVAWTDGVTFYSRVKGRFDELDGTVERFVNADIWILSDPVRTGQSLTTFEQNLLWQIIDKRYRLNRPVWLTINSTGRKDLEPRLGAPTVDRLLHDAVSIHTNVESWRRKAVPS